MNWASDPAFWHKRFSEQAVWTRQLREYLFGLAGLASARRVLEVGCGTGAVLKDLVREGGQTAVHGLDIEFTSLRLAASHARQSALCAGDAHALPYAPAAFDIAFCHYTLLWTARPLEVVQEMTRVVRPGGWILLLAEPDYGGRIDHPPELAQIGEWQVQALRALGADPTIGRRLGALLRSAGLQQVQSGVLGGQWQHPAQSEGSLEWAVLEHDLAALPSGPSPDRVKDLRAADEQARRTGQRLLYVPTFYASGVTTGRSATPTT